MKRHRMGRMLAIGGLALTLLTVACSTPAGTWGGAPAASQYGSPGSAPPAQLSCNGGTAYSARGMCGSPWLTPR